MGFRTGPPFKVASISGVRLTTQVSSACTTSSPGEICSGAALGFCHVVVLRAPQVEA